MAVSGTLLFPDAVDRGRLFRLRRALPHVLSRPSRAEGAYPDVETPFKPRAEAPLRLTRGDDVQTIVLSRASRCDLGARSRTSEAAAPDDLADARGPGRQPTTSRRWKMTYTGGRTTGRVVTLTTSDDVLSCGTHVRRGSRRCRVGVFDQAPLPRGPSRLRLVRQAFEHRVPRPIQSTSRAFRADLRRPLEHAQTMVSRRDRGGGSSQPCVCGAHAARARRGRGFATAVCVAWPATARAGRRPRASCALPACSRVERCRFFWCRYPPSGTTSSRWHPVKAGAMWARTAAGVSPPAPGRLVVERQRDQAQVAHARAGPHPHRAVLAWRQRHDIV